MSARVFLNAFMVKFFWQVSKSAYFISRVPKNDLKEGRKKKTTLFEERGTLQYGD